MRRGPVVDVESALLKGVCVETATPVIQTISRERATQVRDGLGRLRDLDRRTLVAFYVEGQSLTRQAAPSIRR